MLQKLFEQLEYTETLDKANETDDEGLSMCYAMAFALSGFAGTINRVKKPFNPLLGETYEFVDNKKGFKFISEQVSHHPPISAGHAESKNYTFWANSNIKSKFWGRSFEAKPIGKLHIKLKRLNYHIVYNKCTTSAKIVGEQFIDHFGEMDFKNFSTGTQGKLILKEKGMWSDKGQYETEGWVKNSEGKQLYTLFGHWNNNIVCTNVETKMKTELWKRDALPPNSEMYYHYTTLAFQLNYLNSDLIKKLPPTDTRFRPDQRALEQGHLAISSQEKLRLEEKQRAKRKENEKNGTNHKIAFFEEKIDSTTGEKEYLYKGGYWEARDREDWNGLGLLDIY